MEWRHIDIEGITPDRRCGHRVCVIGKEILVFGGSNDLKYFNDLWSFNTGTAIFFFKQKTKKQKE